MDIFLPVLKALSEAGVRYIIAGGLATVLNGFARLTGDIDLILDLEEENCSKALKIFDELGFKPRAPVPIIEFASAKKRAEWIAEKGIRVFSLYATKGFPLEIDLFVEEPMPFQELEDSMIIKMVQGVKLPVLSIEHLIRLKREAGRPQDLEDIAALEKIASDDRQN